MMPEEKPGRANGVISWALAGLVFSIFGLTGSLHLFGYEGLHVAEALQWLRGGDRAWSPGGLVDVAIYLPSALVKLRLEHSHRLLSIHRLLFVFVQPAVGTAICLVFFGLARDLYPRSTAPVFLTLTLAFGTMIWPYSKFGMENNQALWTLASAWTLHRYVSQPTLGRAAVMAGCLGLLALTKATGLVLDLAFALALLWLCRAPLLRRDPATLRQAGVAALIGAAAVLVLLVSNRARYGGWLYHGRYSVSTVLTTTHSFDSCFGAVFGSGKSIFLFSPPLLIGAACLPRLLASAPKMGPVYAALGGVTVWFFAQSNYFCDETWGPRMLLFLVPFLLLPAGCWWETRADRPRAARIAALLTLAAGPCVQALAVLFDYSAHAIVLGRHPVYSVEHNVWDPRMSPLKFNAHLLKSALSKASGGESIPYVIESHYVPWDAPDAVDPPLRFDVSKEDHLDFWWVQERAHWSDRPYWFRVASSFAFPPLLLLALASAAALTIRMRSEGPP